MQRDVWDFPEGISLPAIKESCYVILRIVWYSVNPQSNYWKRNRPKIDPNTYENLVFGKGGIANGDLKW